MVISTLKSIADSLVRCHSGSEAIIFAVSIEKEKFIFAGADKKTTECQVFRAFYEIEPKFSGRPIKDWAKGADPPDILCHDFSGKRIGVELTEWLIEKLVASRKAWQESYDSLSQIIRSQLEHPPRNVKQVTVELKTNALPSERERNTFRSQLFECIRDQDATWPVTRSSQDHEQREFPHHPVLTKYLARIRYWPFQPAERGSNRRTGTEWILSPQKGGYYDPRRMVDQLDETIRKKAGRYSTLHREQGLDELYLVVFYSKGVCWNPPYNAFGFGFQEVADEAAVRLVSQHVGPFQKIFLFSPAESRRRVLQIWPRDEWKPTGTK